MILCGCGRLDFDPRAGDAGVGEGSVDAGLGLWGTPVMIAELDAGDADNPTLTADMLEIFFDSSRTGGAGVADIWTSTRASVTASWSAPVNVAALNTGSVDEFPEISPDGLTLFFSSTRPTGNLGQTDIFVTTRPTRASAWSAPTRVVELSSMGFDNSATASADLLSIYLSSDRVADREIYVASRASTGATWSTPTSITELSDPGDDGGAFVASGGRLLVYDSYRAGGMGSQDLWQATRASTAVPFDPPSPLAELNTPSRDSDAWLSPDLHTMIFSSDRSGAEELYVTTR